MEAATDGSSPSAATKPNMLSNDRCHLCRELTDNEPTTLGAGFPKKKTCERCLPLVSAPVCRACGKCVRDAKRDDPEPYHALCRRCSSCSQVVPREEMVFLAGRLLCSSCDHLFGRFFAPTRRPASDRMKDAFQAWDRNKSGKIEVDELKGVMKGLNPDFPERDLDKIMRVIDTNGNGVIEYDEFVNWIMAGSPLEAEDGFESLVEKLMQDAGKAAQKDFQEVAQVMVQPGGVVFRLRNGKDIFSTKAVASNHVFLTVLDVEEFIIKTELTEAGLKFSMNTGRVATMQLDIVCDPFGPWVAPAGFHIVGFRSKPLEDEAGSGKTEKVVGIDLAPLPDAKHYDTAAALRYAAEHEYLYTLRTMLSRGAIDVNGFSPWGSTALMLAAQHDNVGSLRLLLSSKAKVGIADADGWTALTFASRFGHTSSVDLLLEKGSEEQSDECTALREALRHQHNSTARALLRAGFGPAPPGTFALEEFHKDEEFSLRAPVVNPPGSVYHGPVAVKIVYPKKKEESEAPTEADENENEDDENDANKEEADLPPDADLIDDPKKGKKKMEAAPSETPPDLYYTTDGRDPFVQGRRYRGGAVQLTQARTRLRVVAVRGKERSAVVDEVFVICHYAIPEDVLTGSLQIVGPPELRPKVQQGLARLLKTPIERITTEISEASQSTHFGKWLCVPVCDPQPRHCLKIDQNFARIRGKEKLGAFVNKMISDLENACGAKPENVSVAADHRGGRAEFRAGCINAEFSLARAPAEELLRQLGQEGSFLLSQAGLRSYFADAALHLVQAVGLRLTDEKLQEEFFEAAKKKLAKNSLKRVVCVGEGDVGTVALALSADSGKTQPAVLTKLVSGALPDYPGLNIGDVREYPEECSVDYTIDVIASSTVLPDGTHSDIRDGSSFLKELNSPAFVEQFTKSMQELKVNVEMAEVFPAECRSLCQLEFTLDWDAPINATSEDMLDGVCFIYNGSQLLQVMDYRHSVSDEDKEGDNREAALLGRAIGRAMHHGGDSVSSTGGQHRIAMDLNALPLSVTDLYFVLAASGQTTSGPRDLSNFRNTRVTIHDVVLGRLLTEYKIAQSEQAQAKVMCRLSRDPDHRKWVVHGMGLPTEGGVKNYEPIKTLLAEKQAGYLRWERRKHLVCLRVLWKQRRMSEAATNEFALLFKQILKLPLPAFQCLVKLF